MVGLACAGGVFAAWHYTGTTEVEVPVARVRRGDFIISVRTRGEIKSTRSIILTAPQVPSPRIVKLAESGKAVHKGDVVVEFDPVQQEQNYIEKDTSVRTVQSQIEDTKAAQKIDREGDAMNLMSSEYNVERSKLEASKAEILSEIDGAKNRIDVTVCRGRAEPGQDHHQEPQDLPGSRPGAPEPDEGQDGPRYRSGQDAIFP